MLDKQNNINHHTKDMLEAEIFGGQPEAASPQQAVKVVHKSLQPNSEGVTSDDSVPKIAPTGDSHKPASLFPQSFPHYRYSPTGMIILPATIENVAHLLSGYSISVRSNVIKKLLLISSTNSSLTLGNTDIALATITSLANLNKISSGQIPSFLDVIASNNPFNPVADWINSVAWDGKDRLVAMYDTLVTGPDYTPVLKRQLMYRWLLSAVAAALKPSGFKARGVLTLQGPQGIGKTSWTRALLSGDIANEDVLKLDHHLDAHNKDSIMTAISHWIVEIGELDSSFKRDIAKLKSFLTGDTDKLRRPYAKADSTYPRRTVFCATVNEHNFLVDPTGNSRWWTIPVVKVDYNHGIDMQQLFAQLAVDFNAGKQWWLTPEEEDLLEQHNKSHRAVSVIEERVLAGFDSGRIGHPSLKAYTASQILKQLGIPHPTNTQSRECGTVLREIIGQPKRIQGMMTWRFPFKQEVTKEFYTVVPAIDDDDGY